MEKRKRVVIRGSELQPGDVFCLLRKPKKVVGRIFKLQGPRRYRRLVREKGVNVFRDVRDEVSRDFFLYEFANSKVALLGRHQPKNKAQEPFEL